MLTLSSPSFGPGAGIPRQHTADGADTSPPLRWSGVPAAARSLVLLVEDPDAPDPAAPQRIFAHWLAYNVPTALRQLDQGAGADPLAAPARSGRNDFDQTAYRGPAPPVGRHRYFFRLFALDTVLPESLGEPNRSTLLEAIKGHILEETELMGTYERANATRARASGRGASPG